MDVGVGTYTSRDFDTAVEATRAGLDSRGLTIVSELDVSGTIRESGAEMDRRAIALAICPPDFLTKAYAISKDVALMLPFNVVVRETSDGCVIEALNPDMLTAQVAGGLQTLVTELKNTLRELMHELAD